MSSINPTEAMAAASKTPAFHLAPWLQSQLEALLRQRGHAWLLSGPSGLGQFDLALALAKSWLCERPTAKGACGDCGSCHAVDVHTHADLCILLPETLSLALGWPLDEKTQHELDSKKRKPSKEIKVDAAREAVSFTQFTRSRGSTKAVLVYPAERMNHVTANTLLKTLEEPAGAVKFILATEAAHQLLPTIRSRCLGHTMVWPDPGQAMAWLGAQTDMSGAGEGSARNPARAADAADLQTLLTGAGGRPADALSWARESPPGDAAGQWRALPRAMARGDAGALANWAPAQTVDALQKLCHDVWAIHVGAHPRFFSAADMPMAATGKPATTSGALQALAAWSSELATLARTIEHPYSPGLLLESLVSQAQSALNAH